MKRPVATLKKYRSRFAWVFAVSFVVLLVSNSFWAMAPLAPPDEPEPPAAGSSISLPMLISVASLVTSATSLIGFFFTTGIAWRKERREQQQADLDIERKKLELEMLRREIQGSTGKSSPATDGRSDVA